MKKNLIKSKGKFNLFFFIISIITIICLIVVFIRKNKEAKQVTTNIYNMAFYEVVNYVNEVETYLAKSLISNTPEHGAETLTNVWREANLAQSYLAQLPGEMHELTNAQKFLNQVSDYSYALSRKNIYNEKLTEEDLKNLEELHSYSVELKNILNQLSEDLNSGDIKWKDIEASKANKGLAQEVSISGFSDIEENFHQYSGLIYDGAFSEHLTNSQEIKGLVGNEITEEEAKQKAQEYLKDKNIKEVQNLGYSENAIIPGYDFLMKTEQNNDINISISKKAGKIIYMSENRDAGAENISREEANEKGKEFLNKCGFSNMKETYYLNQDGVLTINYAYEENGVLVYSDLIKVKIALDNGEIVGIETTGYLYSHTDRDFSNVKISSEEAKRTINKKLEINYEGLAIIPTEYKTEILCYEFRGKVKDKEFYVYINAQNGREEDILVIVDTPNGILAT